MYLAQGYPEKLNIKIKKIKKIIYFPIAISGRGGVVGARGVCVSGGVGVHGGVVGTRGRGGYAGCGVYVGCGMCARGRGCTRGRGCPRGLREVVALPRYTPCPRGDTREIKYNKQYGNKYN